jgi:hypothetical protein
MTNPTPLLDDAQEDQVEEGIKVEAASPVAAQGSPQKPVAKGSTAQPPNWFDKVFSRGFTPEDLVLYLLSILLIVVFWSIFRDLEAREDELIASISAEVARDWGPAAEKDTQGIGAGLDDDEWINMQHMGAQLTLSAMRYQQGSISTAAISTRKNLAFLSGVILAIIGCVIIIRGVRQSQTKFDAKMSDKTQVTLLTASPGIFVVLMGAIIIVAAVVTAGERPEINDEGIQCLRCGVVVLGANEKSQPIATDPTQVGAATSRPSGDMGFPALRTTPAPLQDEATPTSSQ